MTPIEAALRGPLAAMTYYHQFITYKLVPRDGKMAKVPWGQSGKINPHDCVNWMTADAAMASAAALGPEYGVGFVLTEADPFAFLDIDKCVGDDGMWTPLAVQLCSMLPGAAIEISQSGVGLHGLCCARLPPHGCRNDHVGIELYHTGRFVALTGTGIVGNVATDHTEALTQIIQAYLQPGPDTVDHDWYSGPDPEWFGPEDDDELIRKMLNCTPSAESTFGDGVTFRDLWERNVPALARRWPSATGEYDQSSADSSLAARLAFWTGRDCERMERIMLRSQLVRDKWDRPDYMRRTIGKVAGLCSKIYVDERERKRQQMELDRGSPDSYPQAGVLTEKEMFERFVEIKQGNMVADMLDPTFVQRLNEWKVSHRHCITEMEVAAKDDFGMASTKTKGIKTCDLWGANPKRLMAKTITFHAGMPRFTPDPNGNLAFNTWQSPTRNHAAGDISLFLEHVKYLFGDDADRFLDWAAHIEQYPEELPHTGWLHVSSAQGTGRNWLGSVLNRVWSGYVASNFNLASMFASGFNGRLSRKILAIVDEIREGGADAKWSNSETLKRIITEDTRTINPKYGEERVEHNTCRWLIFSNHDDALPLDHSDRRFNICKMSGAPRPPNYYAKLFAALKDPHFICGVAEFLANRDLSNFNAGAHAVFNESKKLILEESGGEYDGTLREIVEKWPVDLIQNKTLWQALQVDQPLHRMVLGRNGIKSLTSKTVRLSDGSITRVKILRNHERWKNADVHELRRELEKIDQTFINGLEFFKTLI